MPEKTEIKLNKTKPDFQEFDKLLEKLGGLFQDWKELNMTPEEIDLMVNGLDKLFLKRHLPNMKTEEIDKIVKGVDALFRDKIR